MCRREPDSQRELLLVDESEHELLTYSARCARRDPLMHSSSMEKSSARSATSVYVIQSNNTWENRYFCIWHNKQGELPRQCDIAVADLKTTHRHQS